ncbi:hypothetical protein PsAD14_01855 [Pseudovibrio sp. Ad14]|nr:hypothetical protein PsAD14_01855 [Pseudovibrio sp. Ad14]
MDRFWCTGEPVTLSKADVGLVNPLRDQREPEHHSKADIEPPERLLQPLVTPAIVWNEGAQTEQHEANTQQAIHAKHGGVTVGWCGIETLHVIECQRWIDEEAEQASANQIPEQNRGEEVKRPLVVVDPLSVLFQLVGLIGLKADNQ